MARWGLCVEESAALGERLQEFYQGYRGYIRTTTRDTSQYGFHYLSGMLRMDTKRNMANISRKTNQPEQNIHHFMSISPWSGRNLIEALQADIGDSGTFADSILIIDESADEKSGQQTAGVGRQNNGRLGKVDLCQVGVFASLATRQAHCWVDGELFIPEFWFASDQAAKRKQVGIPETRTFQTKLDLALTLIRRCRDQNLTFTAVDMDSLYGRSFALRQTLQKEEIEYYADIPASTHVHLRKPVIYYQIKKNGQPLKKPTIIGESVAVRELVEPMDLESVHLRVRPSERGHIQDRFSRLPVWTEKEGQLIQEWLLIRHAAGKVTYVLSNAAADTPLAVMATRKTHRYFIERDNQDSKSEFGWDEFQATKYMAWEHQLAFTIMAAWFVTQSRLHWAEQHPQDPELLKEYEVEALPQLSVGNVRELLRAAMPLPQLSPQEANSLVIKHLKNRVRSRKSRLRKASRVRM